MAEIVSNSGKRRLSSRIDLTPMVDLGFLLITFFIFTTTMVKKKTMEIQMPANTTDTGTVIKSYTALKIFIGKQHRLYCLSGDDAMLNNFAKIKAYSFSGTQRIRDVLIQHEQQVRRLIQSNLKGSSSNDQPFILVKPTEDADYSDLVNLMDELLITGNESYALMDLEELEKEELEKISQL